MLSMFSLFSLPVFLHALMQEREQEGRSAEFMGALLAVTMVITTEGTLGGECMCLLLSAVY